LAAASGVSRKKRALGIGVALFFVACGSDGSSPARRTDSSSAPSTSAFCDAAKTFRDRFGPNVAQTAANFKAETTALDELTKIAPSPIAADLQIVDKAAHELALVGDELESAFANSDFPVVSSIDSSLANANPDFAQANKNVKNFEDLTCGLSDSS
jgi:hypothetical protein